MQQDSSSISPTEAKQQCTKRIKLSSVSSGSIAWHKSCSSARSQLIWTSDAVAMVATDRATRNLQSQASSYGHHEDCPHSAQWWTSGRNHSWSYFGCISKHVCRETCCTNCTGSDPNKDNLNHGLQLASHRRHKTHDVDQLVQLEPATGTSGAHSYETNGLDPPTAEYRWSLHLFHRRSTSRKRQIVALDTEESLHLSRSQSQPHFPSVAEASWLNLPEPLPFSPQ